MKKQKNQSSQYSINDFLDLTQREWIVEFEINDFGASIVNLLELPLKIYNSNSKTHFWAFLKIFLKKCEIGFIFRQSNWYSSYSDIINLALIGQWKKKRFAIPLWFLKDLLLGFEIISSNNFRVLDSEPLSFVLINNIVNDRVCIENKTIGFIMLENDIFQGQKIYLKIDRGKIFVSEYFNETEFFKRIALTELPELND